jgi:hypothetical protein
MVVPRSGDRGCAGGGRGPACAVPVDSYPSGVTGFGHPMTTLSAAEVGRTTRWWAEARTISGGRLMDASVVRAEQSPRAPLRAATGFRTYCSAGAKSGRAVPDLPSGDPRRLLRVGTSSYLMAPGPPAFTEIARFPAPPRASGAGVLQRDLLAVLETKDGPQRDGDAFRPVGLPGDGEELRLWLDPFQGGLPANPSSLTIASCFRSYPESSARPFSSCGSITDLDPAPFSLEPSATWSGGRAPAPGP